MMKKIRKIEFQFSTPSNDSRPGTPFKVRSASVVWWTTHFFRQLSESALKNGKANKSKLSKQTQWKQCIVLALEQAGNLEGLCHGGFREDEYPGEKSGLGEFSGMHLLADDPSAMGG